MKNLLLVISITLFGFVPFSCTRQKGGSPKLDSLQVIDHQVLTNQQDTSTMDGINGGQHQMNEKNKIISNDSSRTTHFHGSPNQHELDSIKKAKTDKKFQ